MVAFFSACIFSWTMFDLIKLQCTFDGTNKTFAYLSLSVWMRVRVCLTSCKKKIYCLTLGIYVCVLVNSTSNRMKWTIFPMHTRVKRMAERMHKLFDHFIYMLANADIFSQSSELFGCIFYITMCTQTHCMCKNDNCFTFWQNHHHYHHHHHQSMAKVKWWRAWVPFG